MNLNLLTKTAMKSSREQRHSSIIFCHGKPISFGFNDPFRHAEENAIIDAEYKLNGSGLKGLTIVNFRLTAAGKIGLAKPCPACMDLIKSKGFRRVIWTVSYLAMCVNHFEEIYL